jgi:hypothetical protein
MKFSKYFVSHNSHIEMLIAIVIIPLLYCKTWYIALTGGVVSLISLQIYWGYMNFALNTSTYSIRVFALITAENFFTCIFDSMLLYIFEQIDRKRFFLERARATVNKSNE